MLFCPLEFQNNSPERSVWLKKKQRSGIPRPRWAFFPLPSAAGPS
uniref:Uncharacterized protein n=1 Tax=Anguilla anguilla TaxID=7936 RepID=A0A0E9ULE5_ANGAN